MTTTRRGVSTAVLLVGLVCADAGAQGRSEGRGRGNGGNDNSSSRGADNRGSATNVSVAVIFGSNDRAVFRDYFATNRIRPETLPPGIAKNVARGKPLPPGIAKKVLPADLLTVAPRRPGITYAIIGPMVVAIRNDVVVDILENIF
jgi:hypothetical protein